MVCCFIKFVFFLIDYRVLCFNDVEWFYIMDLCLYVFNVLML